MNQSYNINNLINLPTIKTREELEKLIEDTRREKEVKPIKRKREILHKKNVAKLSRNSVSF